MPVDKEPLLDRATRTLRHVIDVTLHVPAHVRLTYACGVWKGGNGGKWIVWWDMVLW